MHAVRQPYTAEKLYGKGTTEQPLPERLNQYDRARGPTGDPRTQAQPVEIKEDSRSLELQASRPSKAHSNEGPKKSE